MKKTLMLTSMLLIIGGLLHAQAPMLADLTPLGDVWGADSNGFAPFENPTRRGWLGFTYDPNDGYLILDDDVTGDGFDDIVQTLPTGEVWVAAYDNGDFPASAKWGTLGFVYRENTTPGALPLTGDVDNDGKADMIYITELGEAWVATSTGTSFNNPQKWGMLGYRYSRGTGHVRGELPMTGDFNGDGKTDIAQLTSYTDVWVALAGEGQFMAPTRWAWTGFKFQPELNYWPMAGDFNGDGKTDLIIVTPYTDVWVATNNGNGAFNPSERWGWLGFWYCEPCRYLPLTGDPNSDGIDDLLQITQKGDVWVALSNAYTFEKPTRWGWLGFYFRRSSYNYFPFYIGVQ